MVCKAEKSTKKVTTLYAIISWIQCGLKKHAGITSSVIKIQKMFMLLRFTENIPQMWVIQTFLSALINEEYQLCEDLSHLF